MSESDIKFLDSILDDSRIVIAAFINGKLYNGYYEDKVMDKSELVIKHFGTNIDGSHKKEFEELKSQIHEIRQGKKGLFPI